MRVCVCLCVCQHACGWSDQKGQLQCVVVCCSVLQCVAVCCSVLQCVAVCCSVLQCVAVWWLERSKGTRHSCVVCAKSAIVF